MADNKSKQDTDQKKEEITQEDLASVAGGTVYGGPPSPPRVEVQKQTKET